nr:phosphate ABC transporter permease PstA [Gehongia tenuis]
MENSGRVSLPVAGRGVKSQSMGPANKRDQELARVRRMRQHQKVAMGFLWGAAVLTVAMLLLIIGYILAKGVPHITWEFLTGAVKGMGDEGGIFPVLVNTLYFIGLTMVIAAPLGVMAAIYLVEYAKETRMVRLIRFCTENLAGMPSIIFGLFGFIFFGKMFGLSYSLLNGALTATVLILPTIIRTSEEALRAVPMSYREGSLALGATQLRTIRSVVLPAASGGIISGLLLSIGRIVGETAALFLTLGSGTYIATSLTKSARSLALHLYTLAREGISEDMAFATATVLVVVVVGINIGANAWVRHLEKKRTT